MASPKIAAIVPMRHHSERVPGKNYRSFAGKPLYHHIANNLLQCDSIDQVIIDTDSLTIKEDAANHFPQVIVLDRPEVLREDAMPMNDVLLNTVSQVEADIYLQTHSTNPLLRSESIQQAIDMMLDNIPAYDSLFSVTCVQSRLWDSLARPVNHNPAILLRTQDLPPIFEENSCIYIFTREILEKRRNRIGYRPMMFEIDSREAWDIDDELDFEIAEYLFLRQSKEGA